MIPSTYAQWRHCITVECGIPLTHAFIDQRLGIWRNADCDETMRFRRLYGDLHWKKVLMWLEHAKRELNVPSR
ncbi:hypothetical protein [Chitinasiproducens palmae]|uniref:Uncharacterized protein n=1 Tax=Chitinasiproducens palmae TaxID=1770053 RepID=A0A1H2PJD7_9BURK|nr:hypothetical protein [Chitinasiproducens palmae]SDV46436.1 hypothetical protein SAMN05216551_101337 [Chitinasiproducens palmae]